MKELKENGKRIKQTILVVVLMLVVFSYLGNSEYLSTLYGDVQSVSDHSDDLSGTPVLNSNQIKTLPDFPSSLDPLWVRDQVVIFLEGDVGFGLLSSLELYVYSEDQKYSAAEFRKNDYIFRRFMVFGDGKVVEDDIANSLILRGKIRDFGRILYERFHKMAEFDREGFFAQIEYEKNRLIQSCREEYRRSVEEFKAIQKRGDQKISGLKQASES